jgi:hypothetical protein
MANLGRILSPPPPLFYTPFSRPGGLEKNGEYPAESHSSTGDGLAKRISKTGSMHFILLFFSPPSAQNSFVTYAAAKPKPKKKKGFFLLCVVYLISLFQ